jgi:MoxR-like ATPase
MATTIPAPSLDSNDDIALADRLKLGRDQIIAELRKLIVGQEDVIELVLLSLFTGGNSLIVGVPGLAKTLLIHTMAQVLDLKFSRIQFTPDLMPSDITGTDIIQDDPETGRRHMVFTPGPIFANIVLADEINRTPPKTQSALLEAMQEHRVTVQGKTYRLDEPFHVFATQNPIELEGTYPLPEAQLDRFLLRLHIGYPDRDAELAILDAYGEGEMNVDELEPVCDAETVAVFSKELTQIHIAPELQGYVVDLADATRHHRDLMLGVSPRGALALQRAARALAASVARAYVVPDDIKALAPSVLEHRLVLSPEAMMRGVSAADVLTSVLDSVPVPANRQD